MKETDRSYGLEAKSEISGIRHTAMGQTLVKRGVAAEHFVLVIINGVPAMRLVCSPTDLTEMVIGRLYTEGIITSLEEVLHISVCESGREVRVQLDKLPERRVGEFVDTVGSCCSGNHLLTDAFTDERLPEKLPKAQFEEDWIFSLAKRFEEEPSELFLETHSVHSCYLARQGELLYNCVDIGRHNAMDKVIGCALRDGILLSECMLFSSGRLPTDMVAKAIRAGIPVLCSKTNCTDKGAELARKFNLTLIVYAGSKGFIVV